MVQSIAGDGLLMESWECRWQRPLVEPAWPRQHLGLLLLTLRHPKGRRPGLQGFRGPESWQEGRRAVLFPFTPVSASRAPPECLHGLLCLSGCCGAPGSVLQVANVNAKDGVHPEGLCAWDVQD